MSKTESRSFGIGSIKPPLQVGLLLGLALGIIRRAFLFDLKTVGIAAVIFGVILYQFGDDDQFAVSQAMIFTGGFGIISHNLLILILS